MFIAIDALLIAYYYFLVAKSTGSVVLMIAISVALCASVLELWISILVATLVVCLVTWFDQKGEYL